jgi:hypothetical protein
MYTNRLYPAAGGLMSYDASVADAWHLCGVYVGRILKGENPAEMLSIIVTGKVGQPIGHAPASTDGPTFRAHHLRPQRGHCHVTRDQLSRS